MINFFRNIRQGLLLENKTGKYLKYAIGEIVLVVIGILIVLQINNWNENRKLSNIEIEILTEIKSSLEIDLADLNTEEKNINNKFKSENVVINWIESNEPFHDSLSKHLWFIQFPIVFRHQAAPYETLKQLGMYTIKNDSVRKQISLLYDLKYEEYIRIIESQNDYLQI